MSGDAKSLNPEMLILARESRGLKQKELAQRLGMSPGWLSRVEGGLRGVQDVQLKKLSEVLDYPVTFFMQMQPRYGLGITEIYHRKRQIVSDRTLNKIYAQINIRIMHLSKLLKGVEIDDVDIRPISIEDFDGSAKEVARMVRAGWHLPHGPIQNLTAAIEHARGIVIPMDFETNNIDAISLWPPGMPPLFFVNAYSPNDRLRFTLCHELGHVIIHLQSVDPNVEQQADEFAAEFLMPAKEIRPYLIDLSLEKLAILKPYWKVSMAALLKRATDLDAITHRQARTLWMKMGKAGYRIQEPLELDIPPEIPALQKEIVATYFTDMGYTPSELGELVCLSDKEVYRIYVDSERHFREKERKAAIREAERIINVNHKDEGKR